MHVSTTQMLPLKEAAEKFQSEDILKFRNGMKKANCLLKIAGVEMVDLAKLQEKAVEKSQDSGNRNRPKRKTSPVGLLKARIKKYPGWIDGKKAAIESARMEVAAAANAYETNQSKKRLTKLQNDLASMEINFKRDKEHLDKILNADYGNDEPVEEASNLQHSQ